MQRRNFIKTTGIVCALSGTMGGNLVLNLLKPSSSLHFPKEFISKGQSHLNELFKDIKKDVDYDSKNKWVKQMLQPKKILEQKESFGGGYSVSFINSLGNTVKLTTVKGKRVTKFS